MSGGAMASRAEYQAAKISVWWEVGTCPVPRRLFHVKSVATNIKSALLKLGYHGPASISAYGDTSDIPLSDQRDLSSTTGTSFNRVRPGSNDLLVSDPANILIISMDVGLLNAMKGLEEKGFNILLGTDMGERCAPMVAVASTAWPYNDLLAGDPPAFSSFQQIQ